MRTLVLGDLHSNWWALEAVLRAAGPVDRVLCTGDLVDYGPAPRPCVEWVREHADRVVRGNHDHAVAQRVPAAGEDGLRGLAAFARARQWEELGPELLRYLARLPVCETFDLDGRETLMVHGSPRDPLDDYAPADADGWRDRLTDVSAELVLVGHTHIPYAVAVPRPDGGTTTVLNPGSVGQPRDGDPRAAYAIIEGRDVLLHRVAYDPTPVIAALRTCGLPEEAMETAEALLRTGRRPCGRGAALRDAVPSLRNTAICPG
ncbi:metallophosphoesterase family protein [Alienimonas californiensis]|uniref:Phosphodiesterase n=1 Tax=Alienimonas californiensis TaxID=2527989 RepID=A0A517PCJ3_9PLAN|nr:metallophosphoesterase family protein [Alienimonas californiensis]QDT17108.1 phosphodiesterase [Alienimonas californiensis]